MPRFLFETASSAGADVESATGLLFERFPEVELEHRYAARDAAGARAVWVCRAPSEAHLRRWAAAASVPLDEIRLVEADGLPGVGPWSSDQPHRRQ